MKEKDKHSTKLNIERLAIQTFKNIIEGSRSINGVTWNKIKNLKRKDQIICLKQLSQQRSHYLFFIMQSIKNKCLNCNKLFIDNTKNKVKKYCSKYCGGLFLNKFKTDTFNLSNFCCSFRFIRSTALRCNKIGKLICSD